MGEMIKNRLFLLTVITDRGKGKTVQKVLRQYGITFSVRAAAMGTARTKILDYLGLGDREREIVFCCLTRQLKAQVLCAVADALRARDPGGGIAFTVPLKGVGGPHTLDLLRGADRDNLYEDPGEGKGDDSVEKTAAELIITVVNRGYAHEVVEAAREAGAQGGTVMHARGTGDGETEKFFKITIQPEKEIVFLVIRHNVRADVVRAISRRVGLTTPGRGITFTLPVEDVVGAYGFEDLL